MGLGPPNHLHWSGKSDKPYETNLMQEEDAMRVMVTFYSETGNTEKLARAIYEGTGRVDKTIAPIEEVGDLADYDVVFCGFPVKGSTVPRVVQPFLKDIPEGKKLAIFATHGSRRGGQLAVSAFDYAMTLANKAKILGTFGCRGKVKPNLIEALMKRPEHKAWALEAQSSAAHHPDEGDMEDGKDFAQMILSKAHLI